MSFNTRALLLASLATFTFSASGLTVSAEPGPRNFVLIVPEALPAVGVDQTNAPTLARLRLKGVDFNNSHAGFPRLTESDAFVPQSDLQAQRLVAAAVQRYSAAFVPDTRASGMEITETLRNVLDTTLPHFKKLGRPFLLVYRIAEPRYAPPAAGEGRPAYKPAPRATDIAVDAIEGRLKSLGLLENTNIIVAAEHAYSRILKVSHTSRARVLLPREETFGTLPPGFLSIDIVAALQSDSAVFNLFDPDNSNAFINWSSGGHPEEGNAIIVAGYDPTKPLLTVEAHGAYGSIFLADTLSQQQRQYIARTIMKAMLEQDYLGGVFADEKRVGKLPGALSIRHILSATASGKLPDMVIAFASVSEGCPLAVTCTSVIADTPLPEGEGIPNPFNRAGTLTFMAARGPDFHAGWTNPSPASNADIARTIVELMDLDVDRTDQHGARVLSETLVGSRHRPIPPAQDDVQRSIASVEGLTTEVRLQTLGSARYFVTAVQAYVEPPAMAYAPKWKWRWPQWKRITISISDEDFD